MLVVKNNYFKNIPRFLEANGIDYSWVNQDENGFSRVINFELLGISYFIQIYANLCNLSISEFYTNKMTFTELSYDACSSKGLLFDDKFKIVIEPLDWQKKNMEYFKGNK